MTPNPRDCEHEIEAVQPTIPRFVHENEFYDLYCAYHSKSYPNETRKGGKHIPGDPSRDLVIPYLEVTNNHLKGRLTIPQRSQRLAKLNENITHKHTQTIA